MYTRVLAFICFSLIFYACKSSDEPVPDGLKRNAYPIGGAGDSLLVRYSCQLSDGRILLWSYVRSMMYTPDNFFNPFPYVGSFGSYLQQNGFVNQITTTSTSLAYILNNIEGSQRYHFDVDSFPSPFWAGGLGNRATFYIDGFHSGYLMGKVLQIADTTYFCLPISHEGIRYLGLAKFTSTDTTKPGVWRMTPLQGQINSGNVPAPDVFIARNHFYYNFGGTIYRIDPKSFVLTAVRGLTSDDSFETLVEGEGDTLVAPNALGSKLYISGDDGASFSTLSSTSLPSIEQIFCLGSDYILCSNRSIYSFRLKSPIVSYLAIPGLDRADIIQIYRHDTDVLIVTRKRGILVMPVSKFLAKTL